MNIKQQIEAELKAAREIAAKAESEGRDFTPDERTAVKAHIDRAAEIKRQHDDAKGDRELVEALKGASFEIVAGNEAEEINKKALEGTRSGFAPGAAGKSPADSFLKSDTYAELMRRYPNGVGEKSRVQTDPVLVGGAKALIGSGVLPGMVPVQQDGLTVPPVWGRDLTLRDIITIGTTGTDTIEYARQLAQVNAAAPVAEARGNSSGTGVTTPTTIAGTKPESSFTFEKVTEHVRTIAHWMAATKRALSDAGQLRTLIDSFLRYGLAEEVEDQVISGDGTGENFAGILNTTGVQDQAFDTDIPTTVRRAITKVRLVGRARTTAILMNPEDVETVDLMKDTTGRYLGNGPFGTGPGTLWGRPMVESEAVPAGTAIVGDWRYAVMWDREQATISVTDSHADFFIRNLVAILAELRAAFGVIRPAAFVAVELEAA